MNTYANIANAAKNLGQHTISTIKKPPMIVNDNRMSLFYNSATANDERLTILLAHDIGLQCAFVVANKVKLMTVPSRITNNDIGFSLTDDPTHHAPTKMRVADTTKFFLSIVPRDLAAMHHLFTLPADPLTIAPIPNGNQDADRLYPDWYDAADATTTPCFAWIPKIAKMPYDHNVVDGTAVTGLVTNSLAMHQDSPQYLWMMGVATLQALNGGISFHHQTTLFDTADLAIDANNSPDVGSRTERMYFDPTELVALPNGVDDNYQTILMSVQMTVMGSLIANGNLATATGNPEPVIHRTETELKQKKEGDKRAELWQQFLACPTKDANNNDIVYFPDLDDGFKEVLGASTVTEAMESLMKHSRNFAATYQDTLNQGIFGEVTFRFGKHLSSSLIRHIQTCNFNTSNINVEPDAILDFLTPFAFLTPQEMTAQYKETIEASAKVMREVAVGVDSTKQQRMPAKLYVGGQAFAHADFVSMGANMLFLFMLALKDPVQDKPIISQLIEKQVSKTRSQGYKQAIQFRTNAANGNRYIIPHLINETGELIAAIARVAGSVDLQTARKSNDMVKVTALYESARIFCNNKLNQLEDILAAADFNRFNGMPSYYMYLSPDPNSAGGSNQHSNDSGNSPPRKKGKHEPNNSNNSRNNNGSPNSNSNSNRNNGNAENGNRGNNNNLNPNQLGLIKSINKPANWLPRIPATITGTRHGDATMRKICPAFVLVGASCQNQNCNLLHVTRRNFPFALDQTNQNNFNDWVTNSADVDWSTSQGSPRRNDDTACRGHKTPTRPRSTPITLTPASRSTALPPLFISRDVTTNTASSTTVVASKVPTVHEPTLLGAWKRPLTGMGATQTEDRVAQPTTTATTIPTQDEVDESVPSLSAALQSYDSAISADQPCPFNLNTREGRLAMINHLPSPVKLRIQQPFGKDDLQHSFTNEATWRHILLPLIFSDFLSDIEYDTLCRSSLAAAQLHQLLEQYGSIDFRPLRDQYLPTNWNDATDFNAERTAMFTACTLFYQGDMASVARFVGGPCTGSHRDVAKILTDIAPHVQPDVLSEVERIFTQGIPRYCNAESTDQNTRDYMQYGNHSSCHSAIEKTKQAILKDEKRGHSIALDQRMRWYILHFHLCPVGIVDLNHPIKKPRFIYDASHHVFPWSQTINDWTCKETEPELHFPGAFQRFCTWIWNLRITYPNQEIYLVDDDIQAAFRIMCYHPNMISMHGYQILHRLIFYCRATFGDGSSPPNFDPLVVARQQVAQGLYHQPDIITELGDLMPPLDLQPEPSPSVIESEFLRVRPDSYNNGALDSDGNRRSPPYDHHVDDDLYADIGPQIPQAVAASMLALYKVVGWPDPRQPDAYSREKFETSIGHTRKVTGTMVNSRTMTLWLPEYKRDHIVNLLDTWTASPRFSFTILQAAELNGLLIDASRCCRWGRALFIVLQNTLRTLLQQRYAQHRGYKDRATKRAYSLISSNTDMPNSVAKKLAGLVGTRDFATQMWRSSIKTTISPYLRQELSELCEYLRNPENLWQINIGHIIERDHIAEFFGDASHYGCGFYCTQIQTTCMLPLSSDIRRRLKLNDAHDEYLHINCIEYLTALLEYACAVTAFEDTNMESMRNTFFPDGVPSIPVIRSRLDNTSSVSWIRKVASSSIQAQQLIKIYAQILRQSDVDNRPLHIDGDSNTCADRWSRPDEPLYRLDPAPLLSHIDKTLDMFPEQQHYQYFVPSSNLLGAIRWGLRPRRTIHKELGPIPVLTRPFGTFMSLHEFRVSIQFL